MKTPGWFEVDKEGLAKLVARRSKAFVAFELLQNAWDCEGATCVRLTLEPVKGKALAKLVIEDDHPDGFANLAHAYTLFAESEKKADPGRRGRFNFGEKLVLALCEHASITSTKGQVYFDDEGRHTSRQKTVTGTRFDAHVRMTRQEIEEVLGELEQVIPPLGIMTFVNGKRLNQRANGLLVKDALLPTEVADAEGVLRRRSRRTDVEIHPLRSGEEATLYELGIPVMPLADDPFHVNVLQKVPLTMERDAAPPSYLKEIRALVLAETHGILTKEAASGRWAAEALEEVTDPVVVKGLLDKRFGAKAVIYDPSDREANNIATAQGYTIVPGGSLSSEAWERVRETGAILPAGKVTPSPRPFHPDGKQLTFIRREDCTEEMLAFARFATAFANDVADIGLTVRYTDEKAWPFNATYEKTGGSTGTAIFNLGKLGKENFFKPDYVYYRFHLLIHELGHHHGGHLETSYHDALCRFAARAIVAACKGDLPLQDLLLASLR